MKAFYGVLQILQLIMNYVEINPITDWDSKYVPQNIVIQALKTNINLCVWFSQQYFIKQSI